jgi:arabinogalactan endo-1,4-beta-galactosidase
MMFRPRRIIRAMARTLLLPVIAAVGLTAAPLQSAHAASTLTNGGFESNGAGTATPTGWFTYSAAGQNSASYTESGGHSGSYRLSHYSSSAYKVETPVPVTPGRTKCSSTTATRPSPR